MILTEPAISAPELERRTGWTLKPEGLCRGEVCVPIRDDVDPDAIDLAMVSNALRMPLVGAEEHRVWCLGPQGGGRALLTAEAPDLVLPDVDGNPFELRSLRGQKVLLLAWASW
jgi:hypothetical protein